MVMQDFEKCLQFEILRVIMPFDATIDLTCRRYVS